MPKDILPIDATPTEWGIIQDILRQFVPNREVWAFGSRVQFTAKPYSDLDIAMVGGVSGQLALSLGEMADLNHAFSLSGLPYKVDIVDWSTISEEFKQMIDQHRILIFKPQ